MRVTADRQTLILAGETPPRRAGIASQRLAGALQDNPDDADSSAAGQSSSRVTIISARVDAIVTQATYTPNQKSPVSGTAAGNDIIVASSGGQLATLNNTSASLPSAAPKLHQAYVISNRGSASAANAYARTRDLADRAPALIDTYA